MNGWKTELTISFEFDIIISSKENKKMTNKEYIEKNNISFSDAMKMYDNEKYPCINGWLNRERIEFEHKFKVGDFIKLKEPSSKFERFNNCILVVVKVDYQIFVKALKKNGKFVCEESDLRSIYVNSILQDPEVFVIVRTNEDLYTKIF